MNAITFIQRLYKLVSQTSVEVVTLIEEFTCFLCKDIGPNELLANLIDFSQSNLMST